MASVLIVSADADMRTYLRSCLARVARLRMYEACDGREALAAARVIGPNLVVSDARLPGLHGAALCRALRATASLKSLPVILLLHDDTGLSPCADAHLAPPFNAAQFLRLARPFLPTEDDAEAR